MLICVHASKGIPNMSGYSAELSAGKDLALGLLRS